MPVRRFSLLLGLPVLLFLSAPSLADLRDTGLYAAYVAGIKEQLKEHGYDPGPPGGVLDARTTRAILAYQHDAGLPADGQASQELLNHLMFALPKVYNRSPAQRAGLVNEVQAHLADRGYYTELIDGKAGPKTIAAVRQFQADAQLPVTGVIDEALLDYLRTKDPGIRVN